MLGNGIDHDVVAVNLFEGDLPLAVALVAVVGHLRKEGGTSVKAQPAGVLNGSWELVVAVEQQVAHDVVGRGQQEEGHAAELRVPVGVAAILLACEALRGNVEPWVVAPVGLEELEDVVADGLLSGGVALNAHVGLLPNLVPGLPMVGGEPFPPQLLGLQGLLLSYVHDVAHLLLQRADYGYIFYQGDAVARSHVGPQAVATLSLLLNAYGAVAALRMVLEELIGHGVAHLIVFAAGLCPEVGALLAAL